MGKKKKDRSVDKSSGLKSPLPVDRISSLPWPILDDILCRLPIREVVRTSILSKEWKYKWVNLSKLIFDHECVLESGSTCHDMCMCGSCEDKCFGDLFTGFVYHVLLSHCGEIQTFKLDTSAIGINICHDCHLDTWMEFLTRKGVKSLFLCYPCLIDIEYQMPDCVYHFEYLTHLYLEHIVLNPPSNFKGFRNLVHLELRDFCSDDLDTTGVLGRLIRNCNNLTSLVLGQFHLSGHFKIKALRLRYLVLDGVFQTISLEKSPSLVKVDFMLRYTFAHRNVHGKPELPCKLLQNMGCLSHLEELNVSADFLQYLSMYDVSKKHFSESKQQLRELKIYDLYPGNLDLLVGSLKLLGAFSNLRKLFLKVRPWEDSSEDSKILDVLRQSSCWFNALQTVEMQFFPPWDDMRFSTSWDDKSYLWHVELEFIKFVLARSSVLEKMTIMSCFGAIKDELMFMKELLLAKGASAQAKIIYRRK